MNSYLLDFYKANNFKYDNNLFYGIYKQRAVSFMEKGNNLHVVITFNKQIMDQNVGANISNKIKEIKEKNRALLNGVITNVFLELIIYKSASISDELLPILNASISVLDSYDVATCEVCPFCGQGLSTNDPFVRIKSYVVQGHNHCIDHLVTTTNNMTNSIQEKSKKSVLTSLLISACVMLAVVSVILALSFTGIYVYISFFGGLLSYFISKIFFRKFKVLVGTNQLLILAIFSLVSLLLTSFFGFTIDIAVKSDVSVFAVLPKIFDYLITNFSTFGKYFVIDTTLSLVFLCLFVYSDFKRLGEIKTLLYKIK